MESIQGRMQLQSKQPVYIKINIIFAQLYSTRSQVQNEWLCPQNNAKPSLSHWRLTCGKEDSFKKHQLQYQCPASAYLGCWLFPSSWFLESSSQTCVVPAPERNLSIRKGHLSKYVKGAIVQQGMVDHPSFRAILPNSVFQVHLIGKL